MDKIKFAIVGCGRIGKKHISFIENNPNSTLVSVVDPKVDNINLSMNIKKYTSIEELLKSNLEIDIVSIATPNGLHAIQALKVLKANKNVLIEKPMALDNQEAEKIIELSIKKNKKVFIVMQNRFSPTLQWLKKTVDKGILGKVYLVNINCFWNRNDQYYSNHEWHGSKQFDGGTLFTQFSHFIDAIYWIFGEFKNIKTKLYNFNHNTNIEFEDTGNVIFEFESGGLGVLNFTVSSYKKHLESSVSIIAQNGNVRIEGQYMDNLKICDIKNYNYEYDDLRIIPEYYKNLNNNDINHALVIDNAINVLKNNIEIQTNAIDGLKVTEIIQKIYEKNKK